MEELKPKFKIGDIVYGAGTYTHQKPVQCPDCLGKKVWDVRLPSGERFTIPCYTCEHGYDGCSGTVSSWAISPEIRMLTIGSVRIDTNNEKPISYMCVETGIGSGTVHSEETLFAEEIAALAYATERAKEIIRQNESEQRRILELGKKRSKRNPLK